MPIKPEHRFFYPIDWPQLSAVIRFARAKGACEQCGRPHGKLVLHLGDGRWWDAAAGRWRDGKGRPLKAQPAPAEVAAVVRRTRVYLATGHRNHDTSENGPGNLAAWCQRCHILHDGPEHRRRRHANRQRRRAIGDLFLGAYGRS
ncbi:hypothetical protein ASG60_20785 [Methylobacterium sp. Leaf469]|uniref:hypothetical protein n=1 Tax=Methylobacterium sp. Leaf469 TaxID=1736387 RepID=UPI0006FF19DC|nr:hypothetical protein [Methylobacterium sp. Leaf469]KQT96072.1 hypothetical protein ASG60_20785 [Methylobacterium sp. Leaf469]